MRSLIVALFVVAFVLAVQANEAGLLLKWQAFKTKYDKSYANPKIESKRFAIFRQNVHLIESINAQNLTFKTAINSFADLTLSEFTTQMNGFKTNPTRVRNVKPIKANPRGIVCPAGNVTGLTCDWRQSGAVTPIKNQGQCGGCWAFSAVASTEGAHFLAGNTLVSLSEQNLIDCSGKEGNDGCDGGLMDDAFEYIITNKGIDTEASYPYHASDGKCAYKAANSAATLTSYQDITSGSETDLTTAVNTVGPISVAIDASHNSFQFYSSGVYYEPACSTTQLDHGVTAIGIGSLNSQAYYLVKNSWGTDWGMAGYIYMSRNRNNNCGIATDASYPLVA
jgi:cathepsin L